MTKLSLYYISIYYYLYYYNQIRDVISKPNQIRSTKKSSVLYMNRCQNVKEVC